MIYRSDLAPPDMSGFKLKSPPLQNCGHDIPSDPDFDPNCGFMSHDEIAILYHALHGPHMARHTTVEIGARFGWTAKAIHAATGGIVICVDPIFASDSHYLRFRENLGSTLNRTMPVAVTAENFFAHRAVERPSTRYNAFVIDGDHDDPQPLNDAKGAFSIAQPDCIMIFHDGRSPVIQRAIVWLLDRGFKARFYYTPAGMFVCWRGFEGWAPPDHVRDPRIHWLGIEREVSQGVDLGRMS